MSVSRELSMSRESKRLKKSNRWLNSGNAMLRFSCFSVLRGSAKAQVIIFEMASMSQSYSDPKVGRFLRHGAHWHICIVHRCYVTCAKMFIAELSIFAK